MFATFLHWIAFPGRQNRRGHRRNQITSAVAEVQILENRTLLSAVSWTGSAGDNQWSTPANWSSGAVPGNGTDVTISAPAGTTIHGPSVDTVVNSLSIASGNVNLDGGGNFTAANKITVGSGQSLIVSNGNLIAQTITLNSSTLKLNGGAGTVLNATINETGTATIQGSVDSTNGGNDVGGTLDSCIINGNIDLTRANNVQLTLRNKLTLNGTVFVGATDGSTAGLLNLGAINTLSFVLDGNANIVLGANRNNYVANFCSGAGTGGTATLMPNVTIHGSSGWLTNAWYQQGTIINRGRISDDVANGKINASTGFLQNQGTLSAANGGTLNLSGDNGVVPFIQGNLGSVTLSGTGSQLIFGGSNFVVDQPITVGSGQTLSLIGTWTNSTTITASGGTVNLGDVTGDPWTNAGTISATNSTVNLGGAFTQAQLGTLNSSGGTVNLVGVFDNTGGTLNLNSTTGSWAISGGTVRNGIVNETGGAALVPTILGGTLDGVTINGNLAINQNNGTQNSQITIANSLTLNGTLLLGAADGSTAGEIDFGTNQTSSALLTGNATVVFGGSTNNDFFNTCGTSGFGGTLTIDSTVNMTGGSGFLQSIEDGGVIVDRGKIQANVVGETLTINGYLQNQGALNVSNGASLVVSNLMGNLGTTTIAGTGSQLTLGGSYVIDKPFNIGLGQTLTLDGSWTNTGGISGVAGSTLILGGSFSVAEMGNIAPAIGTLILSGTLDCSDTTYSLSRSLLVEGGTINGGIVSESRSGLLVIAGGGTLDNTTINGNVDLTEFDTNLTLLDTVTLNGTLSVGASNASTWGVVNFGDYQTSTATLTGNATILFGGNNNNELENDSFDNGSGGTLTFSPTVAVHGQMGFIQNLWAGGTIVNQGTISSNVASGEIDIDTAWQGTNFLNQGTLSAINGGTLVLDPFGGANSQGAIFESTSGTIRIGGNLTTTTTFPDFYSPSGATSLNGNGTTTAPQLLEVVSQDYGNNPIGLQNNSAYGTLALDNNTYVKLVDQAQNTTSTSPECVYANKLVVPAGSTLDLNGLNVYAQTAQINGTIINGSVQVLPQSTVAPKIVVTATGGTYTGLPFAASAAVTGTSGQQVNGITTFKYYGGSNATGSALTSIPRNAGTYTVVANFASNDLNYTNVTSLPITFTIGLAPLTISAVPSTKTYDGTTVATAKPTVSGLLGTDSVTNLVEIYSSKDVKGSSGSTIVLSSFQVNDSNGGNNYNVTLKSATGTITRASLIISATPYSKIYDGTTIAAATPIAIGLKGHDTLTATESFNSPNVLGTNKSTLIVKNGFAINDNNGGQDYLVSAINAAVGSITQSTSTLILKPGQSATIGTTAKLTASANLSLVGGATGTITFTLYDPNNKVVDTEVVSVNGNGTYTTKGYLPTLVGTYQWVAAYSGDVNHKPISTIKGSTPQTAVAALVVVKKAQSKAS